MVLLDLKAIKRSNVIFFGYILICSQILEKPTAWCTGTAVVTVVKAVVNLTARWTTTAAVATAAWIAA